MATGLRIEDWDSNTVESFITTVNRYKKTASEFVSQNINEETNNTSSYQLTFVDEAGSTVTKRFDKVESSGRGKLLYNQIIASLDAMGHSISEQEKRQILMEVLKKLC